MSQNNVNYADNPTGPQLMDNYLAKSQENSLTTNSGIQRPTYAKAGTFWINSSANPWVLYFYNGSTDVAIGTIGTGSSGTFSVEGVDLSNYVTTNTQQNIAGGKTFTGVAKFQGTNTTPWGIVKTNITKGTAPSSSVETRMMVYDSNGTSSYLNLIAGVDTEYNSNGAISTSLRAYKPESGVGTYADIHITYPATGDPYTHAPTPATSDNSSKIATTAYVKNQGYATRAYADGLIGNARYATSTTEAATVEKIVSIPEITSLNAGQCIIVQPTITSTVADSTIKLNSFTAYPMRYNNAAITTSTDSIVWNSAYPTVWMFDGTYWVFITHGVDSNTSYSTMSVAEGIAGTATNNRVMRADYLAQILEGKGYIGSDDLASVDVITEYSLGTKGYIKFSNNFIIQWGTTSSASSGTSITLPTPFSNTNYSVTITSIGDSGVYQRLVSSNTAKTTTNFTTYAGGAAASDNFSWQAIGY